MPMTRGQILAELDRRGELPAKFKTEFDGIRTRGDADFLKTLDPQRAAMIQAIAEGRIKPPTASRAGGAQILADVATYKPGFNAADAGAQFAARTDLAKGDLGKNIRSLNTAIGHLGSLSHDVDALGNYTVPWITQPVNWAKNRAAAGSGGLAQRQFGIDRQAVADELETAFRGGRGGTEGGTKGWADNLNLNDSPAQQRAAIASAAHLLQSRIEAIGDQYAGAMKTTADGLSLLSPEAQVAMRGFTNPDFMKKGSGIIGGPVMPPAAAGGTPPGGTSPPAGPSPTGSTPPVMGGPMLPGSPAPAPMMSLATGRTRNEDDPKVSAMIDAMARRGASADDINAALGPLGYEPVSQESVARMQAYLKANPGYKGSVGQATKTVDNGVWNRISNSPFAAGAVSAADAVIPTKMLLSDDAQAKVDALKAAHPDASLVGNIIGGIPAAGAMELGAARLLPGAATWAPRLADTAYGALQGFGNADEGSGTSGAVIGGVSGLTLGMAGRGAARTAGRAVRGVTDDAVQYLRARGVPLTAGQTIGGIVKSTEDRLAGLPIVGDVVRNRRREGLEGFASTAFDEGLDPLSRISGYQGPTSTNGVIGERGIDIARNLRSRGYDAALDGVHVTADAPYIADTQATIAAGQALPDPMRGRMDYTLPTRVGNSFDAAGNLTGRDFQQAVRGLRRDAKNVEAEPYGQDFGDVTRQAEGDLEGLLNRQAPGVVGDYRTANEVNRNVEILRDATDRSRNGARTGIPGAIAPSTLADAAAANSKKFGGTHGTTDQPFYELSRAGQAVLPSSVPDSGTTGRYALLALPGALSAAGGGAGYAAGDAQEGSEIGLGTGALLSLAGSRSAQRGLVSLMADRPDVIRRLGTRIYDNAGFAGVPLVAAGGQLPSLGAPR